MNTFSFFGITCTKESYKNHLTFKSHWNTEQIVKVGRVKLLGGKKLNHTTFENFVIWSCTSSEKYIKRWGWFVTHLAGLQSLGTKGRGSGPIPDSQKRPMESKSLRQLEVFWCSQFLPLLLLPYSSVSSLYVKVICRSGMFLENPLKWDEFEDDNIRRSHWVMKSPGFTVFHNTSLPLVLPYLNSVLLIWCYRTTASLQTR